MKRSRANTRCRDVTRRRSAGGMTDARAIGAGAKTRVGKFVHFSGNAGASPPRGGKMTRDRQIPVRDRALVPSFVPPSAARRDSRQLRFIRCLDLAFISRFITFAIFRPKVANAGITRRKPQLRRFKRLTAMRAISGRGRLSTGRSER